MLGPQDAAISKETKLLQEFPADGLKKVWEYPIGSGYASPIVADGKLVYFHRINGLEQIVCMHPETGKLLWMHGYPVAYTDRYGYDSGPRASAVVADGQVFTFGVTSWLHALDAKTGKVLWKRDCEKEYGVPLYFFGSGSSPLVSGELLIVNLGGTDELCVAAFHRKTGELKWKTKHAWGQSYASPILAEMHGKSRVLVFAGGEGKPSTGGLLSIDPLSGKLDDEYFWRANRYTSVNASSPVNCGNHRVFVTQAYVDSDSGCNGGILLEMTAERKWKKLWIAPEFGCHWNTPVAWDGHLYGFSGEKESACELVCYEIATGKRLWKELPTWEIDFPPGKKLPMSFKRGCLLHVDGKFLCWGEWGTLAWLEMSPKGIKILSSTQPFLTQQSWTLPTISQGLIYLVQRGKDELTGTPAKLICYDFRAPAPP